MNVVSRMIKDHERQSSSEFGVFSDNREEGAPIKKIRNIVVALLVSLIVGLGVLQYYESSTQPMLAEQVIDTPLQIEKTPAAMMAEHHKPEKVEEAKVGKTESLKKAANNSKAKVESKVSKPVMVKPEKAHVVTKTHQLAVSPAKTIKVTEKVNKPVLKTEAIVNKPHPKPERVIAEAEVKKPEQVASATTHAQPPVTVASTKPESADSAEMTKEFRTPTKNELAQQTYSAALKLIKKRQVKKAEEYLKRALELNAQHVRAREILAGLYFKQTRNTEVDKLLSDGLIENPSYFKFRQLLARLYVDQSKSSQALAILNDATNLQKESANYHSLVAAIYQQMGNYEQARKSYQSALEIKPEESTWWLGLGLAFESSEKYTDAEKAYVRAKQIGNISSEIRQFIERRLVAVRLHTVSMN